MNEWNFHTEESVTSELLAQQHDFLPYLRSITDELTSIKDRVRSLIRHWPTDGHFKEAVIRQLLRRHLPESVMIGTGFVVNSFGPSTEADVLITDRSMPTLFKEDGLLIVTPESVRAVIEVKTRLRTASELGDAANKLAAQKAHIRRHVQCKDVWAGLFVYEGESNRDEHILSALGEARDAHQCCIDSVAYGADTFIKFFAVPEDRGGPAPSQAWHSFHDAGLAPANLVASLIESLVPLGKDMGSFAWFSRQAGIERRYFLLAMPGSQPERFKSYTASSPST